MPSIFRHLLGYGLCALLILGAAYAWHTESIKVNALKKDLESANAIIKEKDEERNREQNATVKRDEGFEEQDKKLAAIQTQLRKLVRDNAELRRILLTIVPPESLRGLRSYADDDQHEAKGAGTNAQAPGNTKKP